MYLCRAPMDNLPIKQLERNAAAPATSEPLWDEILIRRWIGQVYLYFNMCSYVCDGNITIIITIIIINIIIINQ